MFQRYRGQSWRAWADRLVDELLQRSHFFYQENDRTLTSTTAAQRIFDNGVDSGSLYLGEGIYRYSMWLHVSDMSAVSGNAQFLVGGTMTFGGSRGMAVGADDGLNAVGALSGQAFWSTGTGPNIVLSTTNTELVVLVQGIFSVSAPGTFQPQIALETAAAATVRQGSYIEVRRVADPGIFKVGPWQ